MLYPLCGRHMFTGFFHSVFWHQTSWKLVLTRFVTGTTSWRACFAST